ncbi:MAG: putative methyltransferase [Alteromonadaceae bacterium]|jgi:predicted methyltransferase
MFKHNGFILLILSVLSGSAIADAQNIHHLHEIASNTYRSESNRQRNEFRHPAQTLDFFGIKDNMKVTELWPIKGWYTEVLGPFLKDGGQLTIANFKTIVNSEDKKVNYHAKLGKKLANRINSEADYFGSVLEIPFDPLVDTSIGQAESQDMVVTFRNIHNWDGTGAFSNVMQAAFDVLKPGGILGIVEHKADKLTDISSSAEIGYTGESYVIEVIESAGFIFVGRSGINANPQDTKNYPRGVYALPPTLAMGAADRDKYLSIGESDRMTLKFIKPKE